MINREVTHDEMIKKVLIDSDETQTLNDKLQHLEEIKEYLTPNEYKFSMASIAATEYAKLVLHQRGKTISRQQILKRVNGLLKDNGISPVSYQYIRKFY